jgi:hypothetical protein
MAADISMSLSIGLGLPRTGFLGAILLFFILPLFREFFLILSKDLSAKALLMLI